VSEETQELQHTYGNNWWSKHCSYYQIETNQKEGCTEETRRMNLLFVICAEFPPFKQELTQLEKQLKTDGNYCNYRQEMKKIEPPCMPYLGVHLKDLVYIEDGNQDNIGNMINFKKRDLLVETIMFLQQCQQTPYNLEIVEPFYTFLKELPSLQPNDLLSISKFLEPMEAKK
jgi:hypothetical protein